MKFREKPACGKFSNLPLANSEPFVQSQDSLKGEMSVWAVAWDGWGPEHWAEEEGYSWCGREIQMQGSWIWGPYPDLGSRPSCGEMSYRPHGYSVPVMPGPYFLVL